MNWLDKLKNTLAGGQVPATPAQDKQSPQRKAPVALPILDLKHISKYFPV